MNAGRTRHQVTRRGGGERNTRMHGSVAEHASSGLVSRCCRTSRSKTAREFLLIRSFGGCRLVVMVPFHFNLIHERRSRLFYQAKGSH